MKTIKYKIHLYNNFLVLWWFDDKTYTVKYDYDYKGYYYFPSDVRFIIRGILEQFKDIHE